MTSICLDDPADVGFFPSDASNAVSEPARTLALQLREIERGFRDTWVGRAYEVALSNMWSALLEARESNWDGYGARPANWASAPHALRFLQRVPAGLPPPAVNVDPDGEIGLEWRAAPRRVFSVSIGPDGRLSYAALFGRSSIHGTEAYFADRLPSELHSALCRVFS